MYSGWRSKGLSTAHVATISTFSPPQPHSPADSSPQSTLFLAFSLTSQPPSMPFIPSAWNTPPTLYHLPFLKSLLKNYFLLDTLIHLHLTRTVASHSTQDNLFNSSTLPHTSEDVPRLSPTIIHYSEALKYLCGIYSKFPDKHGIIRARATEEND